MTLGQTLPARARYEDHLIHCRDCRYSTNPVVFPDARVPEALCRLGKERFESYASALWRYFVDTYLT